MAPNDQKKIECFERLGNRHQFCHLVSNQLLRRDLVQYEHQLQHMRNMHH
ncbi:hypothetical protein HanRHA438_Chr17g0827051 [Helianthus annuus]|uniref:Uncharacterized protein n=1 Tax=Helianthus annuus TaxID=4232 RepID=A0A9K3GV62_HELAN|nr:hypothetical protein HanXRQr2_Chr17g0817011 [Helianthus annuus]KAJ0814349.1 hypothetical protein HanPSC8_Chr17g0784641 [Helianthus annuus]KAJ0827544.1 hypothetical protein HanRHA438_Chr17g0827051 [Helianthus annuus]